VGGKMKASEKARIWAEKIQASYKVKAGRPTPVNEAESGSSSRALVSPAKPGGSLEDSRSQLIVLSRITPAISRLAAKIPEMVLLPSNKPGSRTNHNRTEVQRSVQPVQRSLSNENQNDSRIDTHAVAEKVYRLMQRDLILRKVG
jgi:hypothetical protein